MTDRAEIERLLNQTGRTLEGLPEEYDIEFVSGVSDNYPGWYLKSNFILHQSDVIKLLVGALRDALDKQPKWISVKERLPEKEGDYLVRKAHSYSDNDGYSKIDVCIYCKMRDPEWIGCGNLCKVTHWMPLPEGPEVNT